MSAELSPQQTAEKVRDIMFAKDRASKSLGIQVDDIAPAYALLSMKVEEHMLNGLDACHGGFITTLADSAFAFACNSHNVQTLAMGVSVDFVAPAMLGDTLIAEAKEVAKSGRTGVYDILVTRQDATNKDSAKPQLVATLRGKSYSLKGKTFF